MSLLENRVLSLDQAQPGAGPLGPVIDNKLSPRSDTYLSLDHNIRTKIDNNFIPTINAQNESSQQYINDKYVNFTGREQIMPTVVQQTNLKGDNTWQNLSITESRTTTNETTNFSYAGNAEREDFGSNWWRYEDAPRTTTNETTNFSYAGDAAPVSSFPQSNRVLFTGETEQNVEYFTDSEGVVHQIQSASSGVTNWGTKGLTLVENYYPGPNGSVNIQADADEKIGASLLKADWTSIHSKGAGTIDQALPTATNFQQVSKDLIGEVKMNPHLDFGVDSRQTATYQIENLKNLGLSIYQDPSLRKGKDTDTIPSFFVDSNAQDYSGISVEPLEYEDLKKTSPSNLAFGLSNVYENNEYNFNEVKLMNTYANPNSSNYENTLLFSKNTANNTAQYMGKGYSGNALQGNNTQFFAPPILLDSDYFESSRYLHRINNDGTNLVSNMCN